MQNKRYIFISFASHVVFLALFINFQVNHVTTVHIGDKADVIDTYITNPPPKIMLNSQLPSMALNSTQGLITKTQERTVVTAKVIAKKLKRITANKSALQKSHQTSNAHHAKGQNVNDLLVLLHASIQAQQRYPLIAQELQQEGRVTVQFKLLMNGQVQDLKIINSSGSESLDQAAIAAVRRATPFKNIEKYLHQARAFKLDVLFELA